jgi:hypothetical protein
MADGRNSVTGRDQLCRHIDDGKLAMPLKFGVGSYVVVGCVLLLSACGGGRSSGGEDEPASREKAPSGVGDRNISEECPSGPPYSNRWSDRLLGGPSDGPVTLAVGKDAAEHGLTLSRSAERANLFVKVLIGIAAPPGTPVFLEGTLRGSGLPVSFTHLGREGGATSAALGSVPLPDRGQGAQGVADLPGYIVTKEPGCAEITARVGQEVAGPFYLRLHPPAAGAKG